MTKKYDNKTLDDKVFEALSDPAKKLYNRLMTNAMESARDNSFLNVGYAVLCEDNAKGFKFDEEIENAVSELKAAGSPIVLSTHETGFRSIQITNIKLTK